MANIKNDTYVKMHNYVDDLVTQRQILEDALRYQNADVTQGEGMVTMINKVPSLTGVHVSLPYISFARSDITSLPDINFNAIPAKNRGKIFRQAVNIGYPNNMYINNINYYDVEDLEYAFGGPDGYPYGCISIKLGPMFNLTNATTIRGIFYKNLTGAQSINVDLTEVPVVSAKKLKDLRSIRYPKLFLKLKDVKPHYINELFKQNVINDRGVNVGFKDTNLSIALHVFNNYDWSEVKELKRLFRGAGPTAETMDNFNTVMEAFYNINTESVTMISYLFSDVASNSSTSPYTEEQCIDLDFSNMNLNKVATVEYLINIIPIKSIKVWDSPDGNLTKINYAFARNDSNLIYNSTTNVSKAILAAKAYLKTLDIGGWNLANVTSLYGFINGNTGLENLIFGTNLGKSYTYKGSTSNYSVDLSILPLLTHESVLDIFNKVYDLNITYGVYDEEGNQGEGTLYSQTIKLHADVKAKLTPEEIAIATNKGWRVS